MRVPVTKLPEPVYIDTQDKLTEAVKEWESEPLLAIDTESNSLHAYQEQVCLIQFSIATQDYLLDPFAIADLSALDPIFVNPNINKIFHAAEYDLICLQRDFKFKFVNLFDTMVAARILGWEKVGLSSLLQTYFGVKLNKKHQRANWGERPLGSEMLTYAQYDTHFLIRLREIILEELEKKDLMALADEDFKRACHVNGKAPIPEKSLCWRIGGSHELEPQKAAVLQELCLFREQIAAQLDRPVFKVIGNHTMLAIAEKSPRNQRQLREIEGVSQWLVRRYGDGVLNSVRTGLQAEPMFYPKKTRPSDEYLNRMELLRNWRKQKAKPLGVQSDVVLPKDVMLEIVGANPTQAHDLAQLMETIPWRLAQYGDEILALLQKNGSA